MIYRIAGLAVVTILLTGCFGGGTKPTPTEQAPPGVEATLVSGAQATLRPSSATPTPRPPAHPSTAIQPPESYLQEYKTYTFSNSGDLDFNERWFFQVKSGGESADPQNYAGSVCIKPGQTLSVINTWGEEVNGVITAFEGGAWKTVENLPGRGVGASASKLREAAVAGGLDAALVIGNFGEERVSGEVAKNSVAGVAEKYWTSLLACNCAQQRDLWITNPMKTDACIHWKVQQDQILIWVQGE